MRPAELAHTHQAVTPSTAATCSTTTNAENEVNPHTKTAEKKPILKANKTARMVSSRGVKKTARAVQADTENHKIYR